MTTQERKQFAENNARVNRKFQKTHFPKVKRQLDKVVSSLIGTIKRKGPNQAVVTLRTQLWNDELYKPIENIYKQVGVYHANQTYKYIRREAGQKGLGRDEQWIAFIVDELERTLLQNAVVKTSETLRNHLLRVLQDAIRKEKTVDEIVKILSDSGFTAMQAERIVRTEVGRAANTGVKAAAQSFNYQMVKEWIAFRDSRTRGFKPKQPKDHYHMDGQVVDFEDNFVDPRSGENIEYPLAPGGSAAMVINCRCTYVVVPKRDSRGRLIPIGGKPVETLPKSPEVFDNTGVDDEIAANFVAAKTVKEAEEFALRQLKLKYANFKGVDIKIANDMNKAIFNIKKVMPTIRTFGIGSAQEANKSIKKDIKEWFDKSEYYKNLVSKEGKVFADKIVDIYLKRYVSNVGKNTMAWSTGSKGFSIKSTGESIDLSKYLGVFVNNKYAKSKEALDDIVKKNSQAGWFTKDASDFGYIMTHEIGHEIDKSINFKNDSRFIDIFDRERALGVSQLSEKLSKYGATAGGNSRALKDEMIAEAWAEYMTSKSPRPLAKEIGELMLQKYYELNNQKINLDFGSWISEIRKIIKQ